MNENPAYGAELQPFMGIPTFMRLSATRDLTGIDVAVLGIPFDSGVSYRSGTRFGPRKIGVIHVDAHLDTWGSEYTHTPGAQEQVTPLLPGMGNSTY